MRRTSIHHARVRADAVNSMAWINVTETSGDELTVHLNDGDIPALIHNLTTYLGEQHAHDHDPHTPTQDWTPDGDTPPDA